MTNNHYNEPAFPDKDNAGLTKLEYAVIHFCAAGMAAGSRVDVLHVIEKTKHLLDEIKKESNAND